MTDRYLGTSTYRRLRQLYQNIPFFANFICVSVEQTVSKKTISVFMTRREIMDKCCDDSNLKGIWISQKKNILPGHKCYECIYFGLSKMWATKLRSFLDTVDVELKLFLSNRAISSISFAEIADLSRSDYKKIQRQLSLIDWNFISNKKWWIKSHLW